MKRINLPILRRIPVLLLVLTVALVGLRMALPAIVKSQVNKALAKDIPDYVGHVDDVGFFLIAGSYSVRGLTFRHREAKPDHDLVAIKEVKMDLSWRALFHTHVLFDATLIQPAIQLLDTDFPKSKGADAEKTNWKTALKKVMPFDLQDLEVSDGSFRFTKVGADPEVKIVVDRLNGSIHDLGNALIPVKGELPTSFNFVTRIQEHARLLLTGHGQFLQDPLAVSSEIELEEFQLKTINNFLRAYGYFDLSRGKLSVRGSADVKWPSVDTTSLVKMQGLKVIAPKQKFRGARGLFTELGIAVANFVVKDSNQIVNTELHVHGRYPNLKLDKWRAVKTMIN